MSIRCKLGVSFVTRDFSAKLVHLTKLITRSITHKEFALIDVLQSYVSFNHLNTPTWYNKRIYDVNEGEGYDPADRLSAFKKALEWSDKIPIGVIYHSNKKILLTKSLL